MSAELKNTADVARAFGKSRRSVQRWVERGCPRPPTTRAQIELWLAGGSTGDTGDTDATQHRDQVGGDELNPEAAEERRWTVQYRRAKALSALFDLQERRGEIIKRDEVEELFAQRVTEVRSALLVLPRRIAGRFDPQIRRRIEDAIREEVEAICDRYSRPVEIDKPKEKAKRRDRRRPR